MTDPTRPLPPRPKLPVLETVAAAYAAAWGQRDDLLRVAALPALATFGLNLVLAWRFGMGVASDPLDPPEPGVGALLLMLLAWVPMTLFAVNWTRVLLLGPEAVKGLGLRWGRRETMYLLRALLILAAATLAGVIVALPLVVLLVVLGVAAGFFGATGDAGAAAQQMAAGTGFMLGLLAAVPLIVVEIYVMFRLLLALPATALDRAGAIDLAWSASKGSVLRLFLAYFLVVLPPYLAVFALQFLFGTAGLYALAPFSAQLVGTILGFVVAATGSSVLAFAYHRLIGTARPGTAST